MSRFIFDSTMSKCQAPSPRDIGRKAWNLFILKKYFSIPEYYVITTQTFKEYRKYRKFIPECEHELKKTLQYFLKKGSVAIRSSSTAEDMPGISFAGLYTTTLNITNIDDGIAAIIRTWNSVDSEPVKNYCERMNVPTGNMAVIIQHQLNPEVSGVMVTQSPFSVDEVLIECCRGLGEELVSGKITPTRYRVRDKELMEQKGDVPLSKKQLFELAKIGKKIEQILKSPQDIEWAIEHDKIYLLQSRPILVYASVPRRKGSVWTNANVRETIPDPISPMCWSIFDEVFFPSIFIDAFEIPITRQLYYMYRPVELLSGRLYWNVNNTIAFMKPIGPIIDLIEGGKAVDPQFVAAFNAVDIDELPKPIPTHKMLAFSIIASVRMIYYLLLGFFRYGWMSRKIVKSHKAFDGLYEQLVPVEDLAAGMMNTKKWLELVSTRFARRYFGGVFLSVFFLALLGRLLRLRMGKLGGVIARRTTIGILDKTGEMVLAINYLASFARTKLKSVTTLCLKNLHKTDKTFRHLFNTFLRDFGHRGPAEFDIASFNWREDHEMVYGLIKTAQHNKDYEIDRKVLMRNLLNRAKPYEKFVLKLFIPRIEAFTPLRENGKHIYFRIMAKLKDQLLIVAKILLRQGFLESARDIFFLTLEEIEAITKNHYKKGGVLKLVKKRKKEWRAYKQAEAPEIIYETGERITTTITPSNVLLGESLSFGKIKAKTRLIKHFSESQRLRLGEILVTHHTDPGWTPLFTVCSGIIIEVGGLICHAAMVARELGVPAVVIKGATSLIPDGTVVELDANEGRVSLISKIKRGQATL